MISLDKIPANALARFDRDRAVVDDRLRITSIENNAVVPKNHLHPIIEWEVPDDYSTAFLVELKSAKRTLDVLLRKEPRWQPAGSEFAELLNDGEIIVTVYRLNRWLTSKSRPVRLVVSERALTDRIIYRVVPLYFTPADPVAIKQLCLGQPPIQLAQIERACVGCHAYSGDSAMLNCVQYKTRKAVTAQRNAGSFRLGRHDFGQFCFVALSPDGKYAAVVKSTSGKLVLRTGKDLSVPFDLVCKSADIYIYNFAADTLTPLPGACDPQFNEDMPWFSPDGKTIIFSRYRPDIPRILRWQAPTVKAMDLYEVPFNDGKGGAPVPVPNASANGLHQYFARYAPNGKWMSFCRADACKGVFVRKDSDIYLMSRNDHVVTKMSLNKNGTMDSWHDWSSDSRWLIFSSKRDRNQLTAVYLSYIDDNGKDLPPIKIADARDGKMNTPQFVPASLDLERAGNITDFIYGSFR